MQFDSLFTCESLGFIMTDSRSKTEPLSETAKTFLAEKFVSERYGRGTDSLDRYIRRALHVQDDAIDLYVKSKKIHFKRNEFTLSNRYISGTPTLFQGHLIHESEPIIAIKASWDIHTFFRNSHEQIRKSDYWELQGYMALTGAQTSYMAYVLVDTPQAILYNEITKLQKQMRVINPASDKNFLRAAGELERLAKYDDVPLHERIIEVSVERNDAAIELIYDRVKLCRKWMNENLFKTKEELVKT